MHYTKENNTVSSHTIIYVHVYVVKLQELSFKQNDTLRIFFYSVFVIPLNAFLFDFIIQYIFSFSSYT